MRSGGPRISCRQVTRKNPSGLPPSLLPLSFVGLLFFPLITVSAGDSLAPGEFLRDNQTLSSAGGVYELGFFSPGRSSGRYLGVWFKNVTYQAVVWVANREKPVADATGVLRIDANGSLVLTDGSSSVLWSSSGTSGRLRNPVARILDTGNLVVEDGAAGGQQSTFSWQSFDCPDRTLLSGMKLSVRLGAASSSCFTSWRSEDDPSPGNFSVRLEPTGEVVMWEGSRRRYRSGPWNGIRFSGVPEMNTYNVFEDMYAAAAGGGDGDAHYQYRINAPVFMQLYCDAAGVLRRLIWIAKDSVWTQFWSAPKDPCDVYGTCGPFGVCNTDDSPICHCLDGFQPKSAQDWYLRDASNGCVRKTKLNCSADGFLLVRGMKLPDMRNSTVNMGVGLDQCRSLCLSNCSCTAYAAANISQQAATAGCFMWAGDLMDIREYSDGGQDIYVRLAVSELGQRSEGSKRAGPAAVVVTSVCLALLMGILLLACGVLFLRKKNKRKKGTVAGGGVEQGEGEEKEMEELPSFDLDEIAMATDNFSIQSKLGEGGFGAVYKGKLTNGQEIAVKRLSKFTVHGVEEFKNEVRLIAKLQHRNLVRLLGCCVEREERLLVYEYMPNKSLDAFIFEKGRTASLSWRERLDIIMGIARGLVYLHEDSRLRIIHRDLKASNILLDHQMNPRISDFGTARIFKGDLGEENTRTVVGTYGYMSPEYAMDGVFSVKSDVFSFGVLLLEIVSGKKNRCVYQSDPDLNLLGHAWKLWTEENCLELLDGAMARPPRFSVPEARRCIQVGLLCVQEQAEDRPTMSAVVLMLGSETAALPLPKPPGFMVERRSRGEAGGSSSSGPETCTVSDVTITELHGR